VTPSPSRPEAQAAGAWICVRYPPQPALAVIWPSSQTFHRAAHRGGRCSTTCRDGGQVVPPCGGILFVQDGGRCIDALEILCQPQGRHATEPADPGAPFDDERQRVGVRVVIAHLRQGGDIEQLCRQHVGYQVCDIAGHHVGLVIFPPNAEPPWRLLIAGLEHHLRFSLDFTAQGYPVPGDQGDALASRIAAACLAGEAAGMVGARPAAGRRSGRVPSTA